MAATASGQDLFAKFRGSSFFKAVTVVRLARSSTASLLVIPRARIASSKGFMFF